MIGDRDIDLLSGINAGMAGALFDPEGFYPDFDTPYRYNTLTEMMRDLTWEEEDLDLSLADMLEMQTELHAEHPEWGALDATAGRNQLLWLTGELGEVIDVVKKNDPAHLSQPGYARDCLTEEIADVMMYLNDVLLCYDIAPEELSRAYYKKHLYNLRRNYRQQNEDRYGK